MRSSERESTELVKLLEAERHATRAALERLGVHETVHPADIPGIDHYHIKAEWVRELPPDLIIDIIGMQNTGKSEILDRWTDDLDNLHRVWPIEEAAKGLIIGTGQHDWDFESAWESTRFCLRNKLLKRQYWTDPRYVTDPLPKQPNMISRGPIDRIVFQRTYFLRGGIPASDHLKGYKWYRNDPLGFEPLTIPVGAVILFLSTPETSIKRERSSRKTHVKTKSFQKEMFRQYLRIYDQLLRGIVTNTDITTVSCPVPLVIALNMKEDKEACYAKFEKAMEYILSISEAGVHHLL